MTAKLYGIVKPVCGWERRFAELEKRRNERATELGMDPTVIASRATLAALAQDEDEASNDLMKWQRELLLPSL